jgi:phosphoglycolate/pyridoxal phosphate phosphatase family enzyme
MKGVILDLDGVLKRGSDAVPGSVEAVGRIIEEGLGICYLTNNSTRTRGEVMISLKGLGYPEAPVITSAYGAAMYIKEKMGNSRCLVVGERGLINELERAGHESVPAGEGRGVAPIEKCVWMRDVGDTLNEIEVDCVVAGLDRNLTYTRLSDALWAIRNGADLIATNSDPSLPWEEDRILPGAGSIISALERCSATTATVVGKPNPYTTRLASMELGLEPGDILMVGDRYDTDILAGKNAGCQVAMVLSGDMKDPGEKDLEVYKDLGELVEFLFQ